VSAFGSGGGSGTGRVSRLAFAFVVAVGLLGGGGATTALAAQHTVTIDGLKYVPETLTVKPGDTVTWVNKDPFPHTVTAPGKFDSRGIPADGKWKYVARKAGRYDYICTLHPNMKATLVVEKR
jgi:plastocyanin